MWSIRKEDDPLFIYGAAGYTMINSQSDDISYHVVDKKGKCSALYGTTGFKMINPKSHELGMSPNTNFVHFIHGHIVPITSNQTPAKHVPTMYSDYLIIIWILDIVVNLTSIHRITSFDLMACPSRYDALRSRPRNILTAGYASQSEKLVYMCSVQIIRGDESKSFCSMFTQDKRWCLLYWVLHISYCKEAKVIGLYLETSLRPCMGPQFMCMCR